jgi:hypothetical protein
VARKNEIANSFGLVSDYVQRKTGTEHETEGSIMERPVSWKVLTLGAALTGLSVAGAQAAQADTGSAGTAPAAPVSAATDLNAPLLGSPSWASWGSPWQPGEIVGNWVPWRPGQIIENWVPWIPGRWG